MLTHLLLARSGFRSNSYSDWLIMKWLWTEIHWWSIPVYGAIATIVGTIKGWFGGEL